MANEYRSPGAGEGGGTQLEARRSSRGRPWWAVRVVALALLGLQAACATGAPLGTMLRGYSSRPLVSRGFEDATPQWREPLDSGSAGGGGENATSREALVGVLAQGSD